MGTVDDYLDGLDPDDRAVISRFYDVSRDTVPGTAQGKGYGMPALTYRGSPLLSVMRTKKHIGLYPSAPTRSTPGGRSSRVSTSRRAPYVSSPTPLRRTTRSAP